MYYLNKNIVMPLTSSKKISFAELAGPCLVHWFVSHYWGTPFRHFCEAVLNHAQDVGGHEPERADANRRSRKATPSWFSTSYWICILSNNQYSVAEEIGQDPADSSFCLALKSGHCKGTAMILDTNATPLTRSWCLFEVLQTFALTIEDQKFEGLLLCTSSGVLNHGSAGVDVAMNMAKRLANLQLEDASATNSEDKLAIDALVRAMPGGFEAVNLFVRTVFRRALWVMKRGFEGDFAQLVGLLDRSTASVDVETFLRRAKDCQTPNHELLRQASISLYAERRGRTGSTTNVRFCAQSTAPAFLHCWEATTEPTIPVASEDEPARPEALSMANV